MSIPKYFFENNTFLLVHELNLISVIIIIIIQASYLFRLPVIYILFVKILP